MTELQKEFEKMGCVSWVNSHLFPDSKVYTQQYIDWLENQVLSKRKLSLKGTKSDKEIEKTLLDLNIGRISVKVAKSRILKLLNQQQ